MKLHKDLLKETIKNTLIEEQSYDSECDFDEIACTEYRSEIESDFDF